MSVENITLRASTLFACMLNEIDLDESLALVKGIDIPARPAILSKIVELQESPNIDLMQIAEVIRQDVSLSAGVLKAVNSPLFGLPKKISSISQAVTLLGIANVSNIVISMALQLEIKGRFNVAVERFWDTANDVALISAGIAKRLGNATPDNAYTLGLFYDCGIPLLIMNNPNYVDILKKANASIEQSFTDVENEETGTNHAALGYCVAKTWGLSSRMCLCILNHHEKDLLSSNDAQQNELIANLKMAESISHNARMRGENPEWEQLQAQVLMYLDLSLSDYRELQDEMLELLASKQ